MLSAYKCKLLVLMFFLFNLTMGGFLWNSFILVYLQSFTKVFDQMWKFLEIPLVVFYLLGIYLL